jgi:hypothetical protein
MAQVGGPPANQGSWITDIRRLEEKVVQIQVSLGEFMAKTMGRAEIEADIMSRVAQDTYRSDMVGINERITRLEATPLRQLAIVGSVTGCLGLLVSFSFLAFAVITWLVLHYK